MDSSIWFDDILNSYNFYLINRVLSVPEEIFSDFSEEDKEYSISEFRAYLMFAIEAFPNSFAKSGAFGLSGNRFSLPRQWEIVGKSNIILKTPNYYLGNMDFCHLKGDLVYTHPFNFYHWRPNGNLVDADQTAFAFLRPKGDPVIACVIRDHVDIFCYHSEDEISPKHNLLLKKNAIYLSRLFNYPIAEILFFIEDDQLIFGMISNIPYASNKKEWFPEKICTYFEKELKNKYGKN